MKKAEAELGMPRNHMLEHPELLDWQKKLLDQRLRDAEAHPEDWLSWNEAKRRLEQQIHRHR